MYVHVKVLLMIRLSAKQNDADGTGRRAKTLGLPYVPRPTILTIVLSAEQACDIALEYGFNPVVDDEKSFDILPQYVPVQNKANVRTQDDGQTHPLRPPV